MEHLEIHTLSTPRDTELAVIAGLLQENFGEYPSVDCEMCEVTVELDRPPTIAYVVVSAEGERISCEPCLGVAVTSLIE